MDLEQRTIEQGEHVVQFYEREETLALAVASFLADGLVQGEASIVVATPEHRAAFESVLVAAGVDVTGAAAAGSYVARDAASVLDAFMVDGMPDPDLYFECVGGLVRAAGAGGPVRVYGEMVALLWEAGNVMGAMALEELWNELCDVESFALFCAYPKRSMLERGERVVCHLHSAVIPEPGPLPEWTDQAIRRFEPTQVAAAAARRFVREVLSSWGEARLDEMAELIVSELATNAVRYTGQRFLVSLARDGESFVLAVRDRSLVAPQPRQQTKHAMSGRGLHIVAGLSQRWGTEHHDDGKTVWAELSSD